ncbi:MAG: hypothetical protein K2I16_05315, partial [Muribaculaceae bacterium]|nr:hypothetical protein [Muribaculaceae bacterium]
MKPLDKEKFGKNSVLKRIIREFWLTLQNSLLTQKSIMKFFKVLISSFVICGAGSISATVPV